MISDEGYSFRESYLRKTSGARGQIYQYDDEGEFLRYDLNYTGVYTDRNYIRYRFFSSRREVSIPAGNFTDCHEYIYITGGNDNLRRVYEHLAENIGLIRISYEHHGYFGLLVSHTYELVEAVINGKKIGAEELAKIRKEAEAKAKAEERNRKRF